MNPRTRQDVYEALLNLMDTTQEISANLKSFVNSLEEELKTEYKMNAELKKIVATNTMNLAAPQNADNKQASKFAKSLEGTLYNLTKTNADIQMKIQNMLSFLHANDQNNPGLIKSLDQHLNELTEFGEKSKLAVGKFHELAMVTGNEKLAKNVVSPELIQTMEKKLREVYKNVKELKNNLKAGKKSPVNSNANEEPKISSPRKGR